MTKRYRLMACAFAVLSATAAALASAEGGEQPSVFAGSLGNSLVTLIIFGLVVYILSRTAWKPILNVLNERERTIRDALETAKAEREKAAQLLVDYQARIDKAREEASAIVAEGRRDGEALKQRLRDDARHEGEQMVTRARREIQLATDSARKELHDEVSELAVRIAARIIHKELNAADHQLLVAQALQEMQASGPAKLN